MSTSSTRKLRLATGMLLVSVSLAGCQQSGPFHMGGKQSTMSRDRMPLAGRFRANETSRRGAEIQVVMARTHERAGRIDQAIRGYLQAVELDSRHADAWHRLAVLSDKQGAFEESSEYYNKALKLDAKNSDLLCDIGYSYYLQNRFEESEAKLRKALELSPKLARAHNNLGLVLAQSGRHEDALLEFAAAGYDEPQSRVNLATALLSMNQQEEAREQLRLALEGDASLTTARDLLAELNAKAPRPSAARVKVLPASTSSTVQDARDVVSHIVALGRKDLSAVAPAVADQSDPLAAEVTAPVDDAMTASNLLPAAPLGDESVSLGDEGGQEETPASSAPVSDDTVLSAFRWTVRPPVHEEAQPVVSTAGVVAYVDPPPAEEVDSAAAELTDRQGAQPETQSHGLIRRVPPVFRPNPFRRAR